MRTILSATGVVSLVCATRDTMSTVEDDLGFQEGQV
jgi:hypothetical protein